MKLEIPIISEISLADITNSFLEGQRIELFSEFYNAKQRFCLCTGSLWSRMIKEDLELDSLIYRLCNDAEAEIEIAPSLFLQIIFRADYIQISDEVKQTFYRKICAIFILSAKIGEIIENLDELHAIPHVEIDILKTLLNILNIYPCIQKESLTLTYLSREKSLNKHDFTTINNLIILPRAYKIMFAKDTINFFHINLILKLLRIEKLTLEGCNLSWKYEGNLLHGTHISYLNMSNCGTSVNKIIQDNFEDLKNNLKELEIVNCPVFNDTLLVIRQLDLNTLNLKNCLKTRGYFVGSLWSEVVKFGNFEEAKVDINLLWEEGNLKNTLRCIDISCNEIELSRIERTSSKRNLDELITTESNKKWNCELCVSSVFARHLKVLRIRDIEIDFTILSELCNLCLEIFEFSFDAVKEFNDFTVLAKKPIAESLRELVLDLKNHCQSFVCLISNLKLTHFECKLGTWYYYNFDSFWDHPYREHLKVLKLEDGKISENDAEGISRLNLITLNLHPFLFDSKEHILKVLSSKILQNSVINLGIGGAYEVDNDHLNLLSKFEKLEELSLKLSGTNLTKILSTKFGNSSKLKYLKLKVYIGLNIDESSALALCGLPRTTELTIILIGLGKSWPLCFTEKAYNIFMVYNSFLRKTKPVHLHFSDCTLNWRCAQIFKNFHVESIVFNSCVFDNFLEALLDGKFVFTLQNLTLRRVDIDEMHLQAIQTVPLTELAVLTSTDDFSFNKLPVILSSGLISKSLSVLKFGPYSCIPYIEEILNTKLSVYELCSTDML